MIKKLGRDSKKEKVESECKQSFMVVYKKGKSEMWLDKRLKF